MKQQDLVAMALLPPAPAHTKRGWGAQHRLAQHQAGTALAPPPRAKRGQMRQQGKDRDSISWKNF